MISRQTLQRVKDTLLKVTGQSTVGEKLGFFLSGGFSSLDEKKKKRRVALAYALSQNRLGLGRQRREPVTQGAGLEGRGQVEPPL